MTITQISRASLLKDAKFGWDLVPLPAGPKGKYAVIGQAGLGVLKKGKNADVAADFLAYFTNPANSAKLAAYFPPPRKSLLTAETLAKTNPLLKPRAAAEGRHRRHLHRRGQAQPQRPGRDRPRPCAARSTRCGSPTRT